MRIIASNHTKRRRSRTPRAFTLVEAIVVIAIIAIMAAFIAPRFTLVHQNEARLAVDQVADLMRMWAYRNSVMTQQVGIWRRDDSGLIELMIRDLNPDHPDDGPEWQPDRLSMSVRMPTSAEIVEVFIDGESMPLSEWFVMSNADGSRPRFEVGIRSDRGVTRLSVEPYSTTITRSDDIVGGEMRAPIDLDREGEERVSWRSH